MEVSTEETQAIRQQFRAKIWVVGTSLYLLPTIDKGHILAIYYSSRSTLTENRNLPMTVTRHQLARQNSRIVSKTIV